MKCAINIIFLLGPIFIPRAAAIRNSVILSMAWFFFLQHWFIFIRFFQDHVYIWITSHVLRVKHSRERGREREKIFSYSVDGLQIAIVKSKYDSMAGGILRDIHHMYRITYHSWLSGRIKTMLFVTFSALYARWHSIKISVCLSTGKIGLIENGWMFLNNAF